MDLMATDAQYPGKYLYGARTYTPKFNGLLGDSM
jgi:hypothetical protein